MEKRSESMKKKLDELKERRKEGKIGAKEFYLELVSLVSEMSKILKEEEIKEEEVKNQIPLLLAFLESQTKLLGERGH